MKSNIFIFFRSFDRAWKRRNKNRQFMPYSEDEDVGDAWTTPSRVAAARYSRIVKSNVTDFICSLWEEWIYIIPCFTLEIIYSYRPQTKNRWNLPWWNWELANLPLDSSLILEIKRKFNDRAKSEYCWGNHRKNFIQNLGMHAIIHLTIFF